MSGDAAASLFIRLALTDEQRRQIVERTGVDLKLFPYESRAPKVRYEFGDVTLEVSRGVFGPTPATERLLSETLRILGGRPGPVVADVGTGCGAVALAVAAARPDATVYGTEISERALQCARQNRIRLGRRNVSFRKGSLLAPLPASVHGAVDAIAANVPYVPPRLFANLSRAFPPGTAIGPGDDGLDLVRELVGQARHFLKPGGSLILQVAGFQWTTVADECVRLGYAAPRLSDFPPDAPAVASVVWEGARSTR